jgi:hypothetical protein
MVENKNPEKNPEMISTRAIIKIEVSEYFNHFDNKYPIEPIINPNNKITPKRR